MTENEQRFSVVCAPSPLLYDHGRADANPAVEIDHVLIGQADAARRDRLSDRVRLVRAVNAIEARAEIHSNKESEQNQE
jgi:hypothetical protein